MTLSIGASFNGEVVWLYCFVCWYFYFQNIVMFLGLVSILLRYRKLTGLRNHHFWMAIIQ